MQRGQLELSKPMLPLFKNNLCNIPQILVYIEVLLRKKKEYRNFTRLRSMPEADDTEIFSC